MKKSKLPAQAAGGAKKLKSSLQGLFDKLESSHAQLLEQAQAASVQQQLKKAAALGGAGGSTSSLSGLLDPEEIQRRQERRQRFREEAAAQAKEAGLGKVGGTQARQQGWERRPSQEPTSQITRPCSCLPRRHIQDRKLVEVRAEGGRARGENTSLEKEYLRLTSLPSVGDVRPPAVLRQALELVKGKWVEVRRPNMPCAKAVSCGSLLQPPLPII